MSSYYSDQEFTGIDYTQQPLDKGEYDNCTFRECNFESLHLSIRTFLECTFINCNLTNVKFGGTSLNQVLFDGCKLLGADFSVCNIFMLGLRFRESVLNLSNFTALPLKKTTFIDCPMAEVDFTEADLSEARFDKCILTKTNFENSKLLRADFRTAIDYTINPTQTILKGALFSNDNLAGLLRYSGIIIK